MSTNRVDRNEWPYTTPGGHVYSTPDTFNELRDQLDDVGQAAIECWDAQYHPPEPRWEHVAIAAAEVRRLNAAVGRRDKTIAEMRKILAMPDAAAIPLYGEIALFVAFAVLGYFIGASR